MALDLMSSKIRINMGCGFSKQRPREDIQKKINARAVLPTRKINEGKRSSVNWLGVHCSHVMTEKGKIKS
jgi:hypothetical protein